MSRTKTIMAAVASAPQAIIKAFMQISDRAVDEMRAKPGTKNRQVFTQNLFAPYKPMPGVLPSDHGHQQIVMDSANYANNAFIGGLGENVNEAYNQGYAFPGFQVLAQWSQITEFRKPAETFAREMTRKWLKIVAAGESDKTDKIKAIEDEFERLDVREKFRTGIEWDGFFGRSQIFLDMGIGIDGSDPKAREELKSELAINKAKVNKDAKLRQIVLIDPTWSYPGYYNANNPLSIDFYKPKTWYVMANEVHSSRLLTIITRELPPILRPAYAFSGLSLSQMMKPYVDNWLRTRQSVSDLIHSFTVWVLKTNLGGVLNNGAATSLFNRLTIFNQARDNHGVNIVDKDTEDFTNINAQLGGLDKLLAQSQEQMCAPCSMPLVYMTGITPSGLNASSEGDIEIWQDNIAAQQQILTPHIKKILELVQLSEFGEIDPDISFEWESLRTMTPKEKAEIEKLEAETDAIDMETGALQNSERRAEIANREDSRYPGLDLSVELEAPVEEPGKEAGMENLQEEENGHDHDH